MEANAMTKRIVSGIFILIALGALGVILAGALTSGEQLIVRFLIAVIVAALGLYVISDLRLQADDDAAARNRIRSMPAVVPANSTAAFMARVAEADQDQDGDTFADWASELRRSDELSDPSVALVRSTAATERSESTPEESDTDENTAPRADENTAQRADENTAQRADENTAQRADEDEATTAVGEVGAAPSSTSETDSAVVEGAESPIPIAVPLSVGPAPATIRADQVGLALPAPGLNGHRLSANGLNGHSVEDDGVGHGTSTVTKLFRPGGPSGTGGDDDRDAVGDSAGDAVGAWPVFGDTDDPTGPDGLSPDTSFAYADDLEADYEWPAPAPVNDGDAEDAETDADDRAPTDGGLDTTTATPVAQDTATDASVAQDTATDASVAQDTATDASVAQDTTSEGTDDEVVDDDPSAPVDLPILGGSGLSADYADRPLAPIIDLRTSPASAESNIQAAVRAGELEVIATLIEQGMLSTTGPISDRDVRTMIYVAFTSNELRKLLRAGGMPGTVIDLDLGPVELFDGPGERPALFDGPGERPALIDGDVPSDATTLPESVQVQLG
jgi:hypothetical protein